MLALVGCSEPVTGGADGGPDSGFIVRDAGSDVDAGRTSEDAGPDANLRDANLNDAIFAEPDLCIAAAETCNGLDDDCDGTVDDGVPTGASCSAGIGACARTGTTLCVGGALTGCSAVAGAPGTETCNSLDDDCDGTVDDGVPTGAPCSSGVGACARTGTTLCVGGALTGCSAVAGAPGTETCNTVDDDCDGTVDEDICYIVATGGAITTDGDFRVHTFTSSGTFEIVSGTGAVASLVVAGGGGGGGNTGGGGGAGGLISTAPGASYTARSFTVTVGPGGPGGPAALSGTIGANSVFDVITAAGGGGGGHYVNAAGNAGGSGGGGGGGTTGSAGGMGTAGQGNSGGAGFAKRDPFHAPCGGGGGAGSPGAGASSATAAGQGGTGSASSITGFSVTYASGGGGGVAGATAGSASAGGGGAGTNANTPTAGAPNTGGGGGGGGSSGSGAAGGSGVVILRYRFR